MKHVESYATPETIGIPLWPCAVYLQEWQVKWLRQHLAAKLLLLMFFIAVIPYAGILIYNYTNEIRSYQKYLLKEQSEQLSRMTDDVQNHFAQLYRELAFLAGSVVMEDVSESDPEGRIASLLARYQNVFAIDISLLCINLSGKVIASTRSGEVGQPYSLYPAFERGVGRASPTLAAENLLMLEQPIYADTNNARIIGYVIMEYGMGNLNRFNLQRRLAKTSLFLPESQIGVGPLWPPFALEARTGMVGKDDAIWLFSEIEPPFTGWYVLYRIDRAEQAARSKEMDYFLMLMLFVGIVAIASAAFWFSRRITAPLHTLQEKASEMVRTRDYSIDFTTASEDEIGELAAAFNALAVDVQRAFDALKKENFFRLKRLTQMIGLFNNLMQADEESACLKTALVQLKAISPEYNVRFSRYGSDQNMPSLHVYDYDHDTVKYYGSLIIPEGVEEEEMAFFRAVASMVAARIDQIRIAQQLRRDSEAKTAFISHISHDLRTPLHAILSQTQFLVGYGKLTETDLERVGGIEHAAQQLLGMINDLLELARLDSGKFEPRLEALPAQTVTEMLEEAGTLLKPLAEQKGLEFFVSQRVPAGTVMADRRLLRQIMLNLISNAVKFTDSGRISCRFESSEDRLCLFVQDTGRGIDPETLKALFEPFRQSENRDQDRGSGLGLALSRRFAQQFGAELMLFSNGRGEGTVARLCFSTL